ncbi:MFS transporter [Dysgonomonas sp. Marseille-P4677]|uniref:MFS transporter n=1 Tax=Dysgonomonas sp. Marseille-P4677 TaxID=2364790 RepID=UPI001912A839|nr:MFS transporter [Dysgonomonas sp. Marseille-P4677]MBK5720812.1 MFS transporter [Dysgonomonas sp. Marseille-P4677]
MERKSNILKILFPVMLSFFVMGMVDIVGVSTNFVRKDFHLNDFTASILPIMVFLWFALFSIPAGMLMNKIGRKKTVLISIAIGVVALLIPYFFYNFYCVIFAFALLGIGNTILQVSLNPLVAGIVTADKLTSVLTFGQFVKAIASFLGPIIATFVATRWYDWRYVFVIYAVISIISFIALYSTSIKEEFKTDRASLSTFAQTLSMLKESSILQLFLGIVLIVGIDVAMNTNTPELLIKKINFTTDTAGIGSSIYFGARTLGAFIGAMILVKMQPASFLRINMFVAIIAFLLIMFGQQAWLLYGAIILVGFTCANVFSILFSIALQKYPESANSISSLMIMGVAGGAIVTPIVGLVANNIGIGLSFGVLLLCVVYILFLSYKFSNLK